ncbi:cAMP-binding domain of CRP or a regulatory subunit of cAMP-dependent protein kinases [Methylobacterium gossipiicola]|uniref:cAMP-binding domain of CRP or a regulatory subunit of cAMP-dependent protein kinases n=2 Tax=Methylobacterium gossipiicola TaxID=582675 RepID=A0A1I2VPK2_9HYPH|nr:cAMP-binding domain of CRP or a regulatory subunit of cAMP-dependent protein kinases [Methylobacterium gossipiicola]
MPETSSRSSRFWETVSEHVTAKVELARTRKGDDRRSVIVYLRDLEAVARRQCEFRIRSKSSRPGVTSSATTTNSRRRTRPTRDHAILPGHETAARRTGTPNLTYMSRSGGVWEYVREILPREQRMPDPLVRKLQHYGPLSDADRLWLAESLGVRRQIAARTDIIMEGEDPRAVNVVLDGWACRYKQLADGRRQIVSMLLPGDPCDPHIFLLDRMDHAVCALTPVTLAQIRGSVIQELTARSQNLDYVLHRETLANAAIQREWAVSLGCRTGIERLAHLFCELFARLSAVGLTKGDTCAFPITQNDLADALGQTSVHINRTLQDLRSAGLITLRSRQLTLHDPEGLARLAHFDPAYLHFTMEPNEPDPMRS